MITTTILALAIHGHLAAKQAVHSGMLWEETQAEQQMPGYHPMVRFNTPSTMIRFSPPQNYMLLTPDWIQQGQFGVNGSHYTFRSVSAFELEKADVSKLIADMDPQAARNVAAAYSRSTLDFEGTYNPNTGGLTITYPVNGSPKSFELFATTQGDDQLPLQVSGDEVGMVGVWNAIEPYPDKLDARTREKIELDGVQRFAREAKASNGAQFNIIDLHRDGTFRVHSEGGTWSVIGSTLHLRFPRHETVYNISTDGSKLLAGKKPIFSHN